MATDRLRHRAARATLCRWFSGLPSISFLALLLFVRSSQGFLMSIPRSVFTTRQQHTRSGFAHVKETDPSNSLDNDEGIGVGIDLGTTYSCVAVLVDGIPQIIPIPNNGRTLPSVVSFDSSSNDKVLVGRDAIENEVHNPAGSYRNVKRVIGTGGLIARETAQVVPNLVLSSMAADTRGGSKKRKKKKKQHLNLDKQLEDAQQNPTKLYLPRQQGQDVPETVSPEIISSHVLKTLFDTAEHHTGKKVTRTVVGVPAYFNDAQRQATIRACEIAGVSKVKLLREPEAAAFAYGVGKQQIGRGEDDELVLVFDLGGGTYDVSVLNVGGGVNEVIATGGNARLGGSDFDARIAQHFCQVLMNHGVSQNFVSMGGEVADAVVKSAEQARIYLSNNRVVSLALPLTQQGWSTMVHAADIMDKEDKDLEVTEEGVSNSTHVLYPLSRKSMELLCKEDFQSLLRPVREVAIMAGALLPGDASPSMVDAALEFEEDMDRAMENADGYFDFGDFYKEEKTTLAESATSADPSEIEGVDEKTLLALQEFDMKEKKRSQQKGRKKARNVAKQERKFREEKRKVNRNASADVKVRDGIHGRPISQVVLVGGATRMPAIGRLLAAVTGVVPQKTVNPDEAVALGCAVQAGLLDGNEDLGDIMVLTPMQAAIMRAVAEKEGLYQKNDRDFDKDFG